MKSIKTGFSGIIKSIDEKSPAAKWLVNMGLTPNTPFSVTHIAPLGDPVIINVRNYSLVVRKKELAALIIE